MRLSCRRGKLDLACSHGKRQTDVPGLLGGLSHGKQWTNMKVRTYRVPGTFLAELKSGGFSVIRPRRREGDKGSDQVSRSSFMDSFIHLHSGSTNGSTGSRR